MTAQRDYQTFHHYETRDGRIIPLARVTASGRTYRLIWKHCQECGTAFLAVRSDARFDSPACRAKASRRRRALRRYLQEAKEANADLLQMDLL